MQLVWERVFANFNIFNPLFSPEDDYEFVRQDDTPEPTPEPEPTPQPPTPAKTPVKQEDAKSQVSEATGVNRSCSWITRCAVGVVGRNIATARKVFCSIPWPVKSNTVSSAARHRCDVPLEPCSPGA